MSQETTVLLRTLLFQAMLAEENERGVSHMIRAISAMCTKDDIAAVKEQVAEELKELGIGKE